MKTLIRIMLSWFALFVLAACSLGLTGCSKGSKGSNKDFVTYSYSFSVNELKIQDRELIEIAESINSGLAVSHNQITRKFQEALSDEEKEEFTAKRIFKERMLEEGLDYEAANYVVIVDSEQTLPGKMVMLGDHWMPHAALDIEDEASYGSTYDPNSNILVMDASLYILLKIYGDALMSPTAAKAQALEVTAEKYGIIKNFSEAQEREDEKN